MADASAPSTLTVWICPKCGDYYLDLIPESECCAAIDCEGWEDVPLVPHTYVLAETTPMSADKIPFCSVHIFGWMARLQARQSNDHLARARAWADVHPRSPRIRDIEYVVRRSDRSLRRWEIYARPSETTP
jgi:hypothetical protein